MLTSPKTNCGKLTKLRRPCRSSSAPPATGVPTSDPGSSTPDCWSCQATIAGDGATNASRSRAASASLGRVWALRRQDTRARNPSRVRCRRCVDLFNTPAQVSPAENNEWDLKRTRLLADLLPTLLGHPPSARLPLARQVLTVSLPPYFKPHPKLNPATGRVLSRPLGGEGALNTWFESSEQDATSWRRQVGLAAVVNLVIEALQVRGLATLSTTKAFLTVPCRPDPARRDRRSVAVLVAAPLVVSR